MPKRIEIHTIDGEKFVVMGDTTSLLNAYISQKQPYFVVNVDDGTTVYIPSHRIKKITEC